MAEFPAELRFSFDAPATAEARRALGEAIDLYNARSVPRDAQRFALLLHEDERLAAGLCGVVAWQWLFVEALWVDDTWRGRGVGSALLARAEAHAVTAGCHSVWLDTFQARRFYAAHGYREFGTLEDYPPGQTRYFMRKSLTQNSPLR
jgi:GNAT superfamily N-acetyltransferase